VACLACHALAPVRVTRQGATIAVDLCEGSIVAPGTACIELAMRKTVRVSLGALERPGSYLVVTGGRTARLQVRPGPGGLCQLRPHLARGALLAEAEYVSRPTSRIPPNP
jgi:hypothetical protein